MSNTTKLAAGADFPAISWPAVGGGRVDPQSQDGWRLLIVYRGKHCPLCKKYLDQLQGLQDAFRDAGITVSTVSADPQEKAEAQAKECGWTFPIGYGLSVEQMRQLGLYVSDPRSAQETDRQFAEPGAFVISPQGKLQIIDISNAPFSRPDLQGLLNGIKFVKEKDYPVRGTA